MDAGQTQAQYIRAITVRVVDARTGLRRAEFHPAVPLWIAGISPDGTQLFGWRVASDARQKPEWDVLSTTDGAVVDSLQIEAGCCSATLYDAAVHRLYSLDVPPEAVTGTPVTPALRAYDLLSGRELGHVTLDGMLAGPETVTGQANGAAMFKSSTPGFALSPDESQIAVLDGDSNRLDLIDTQQLKIVRSVELSRPKSLLERLADALGLSSTPASAKEWLGVQLTMSYSPDGHYLYVSGREGKVGSNGKWTVDGLGLRLIDITNGQIVADALSNQWVTSVTPSPDGSAIYSEAGPPMSSSPVSVSRQDPSTLKVTAERSFSDPPELYFLTHLAPPPPSWLQAWPMSGHDPQHTSRSPASSPIEPHLLFQRKGLLPELAGPDGSIYALSQKGLVALDSQGKQRWAVRECCGEGPPALAPNGMILGTGFHTRGRPVEPDHPATQSDTEAIGITSAGRIAWRIQPFGVLKGAVPIVSEGNILYLPIVGPEGADAAGLNIMSTDGKPLRKLPRVFNLALAPDGTIYGIGDDSLQRFSPEGKMLWEHPLQSGPYGVVGPLVGRGGVTYVGDGAEVDAFDPTGRLLWQHNKTDRALALAERSDGVLLVAGRGWLDALQPDGTLLWHVQIGKSRGIYASERPSLIVDGDGTAYVGSADGLVRAISVDGQWIMTFGAGGSQKHLTPGLILDAEGRLIVSGTDSMMRVYGP
jgi:outer membrane protein assembly factor BamB/DNA-binding beta-propeller fold protein YncE